MSSDKKNHARNASHASNPPDNPSTPTQAKQPTIHHTIIITHQPPILHMPVPPLQPVLTINEAQFEGRIPNTSYLFPDEDEAYQSPPGTPPEYRQRPGLSDRTPLMQHLMPRMYAPPYAPNQVLSDSESGMEGESEMGLRRERNVVYSVLCCLWLWGDEERVWA
jgi:hypothetical protein